MCDIIQVSHTGYRSWLDRPESSYKQNDIEDKKIVKKSFISSKRHVGTRPLKKLIERDFKRTISRRRIARLMREENLEVKTTKKYRVPTSAARDNQHISPNQLKRCFEVSRPNHKWVGDITYIPTEQGWCYLAVYMDLFSRKVVGWSFDSSMTSDLVEQALQRAIWSRKVPKGLMVHTDQGTQFTSKSYKRLLHDWGMQASMSGRGNCWDNAVIESFFKTLKRETIYSLPKQMSKKQMQFTLSEYIGYYNQYRLHSHNDYYSPNQFEDQFWKQFKQIPCTQKY
jgi:transposase InsO family protein